jgi:hypothetical protein
MLLPDQTILPPVPVPSSINDKVEIEATSNGIVFMELEVVATEVPITFVAVTAKV